MRSTGIFPRFLVVRPNDLTNQCMPHHINICEGHTCDIIQLAEQIDCMGQPGRDV